MGKPRDLCGLLAIGLAGVCFYACSASSGPDTQGNFQQGAGASGNGAGTDASLGTGNGGSNSAGAGGAFFIGTPNGAAGNRNTVGDACPAIQQKPETIKVYKDATVTDTIYKTITIYKDAAVTDTVFDSKPVALFVMMDRSGSMVTGFPPPASAQSWSNATAAITAFVNDPQTVGLDMGLGTFPYGANNTADCSGGSDCGTPVVPIASLPGNGNALIQAMNAQTPNSPVTLTPTECGLRGMINECLAFMAQSQTGEQCVAILVTDGTPTQCDTNQSNLQQIVTDGHSKGVAVYTLGLPGADLNALNALAQAGGTNAAIDVSGGAQAFIAALNNIRQKVAVTTTTHVTTSRVISTPVTTTSQVTTTQVISTPLPCQWKIPPAPAGTTFDKTKVNVQFVPPGAAPVQFGYLQSPADCSRASGDAWYYDDPNNPTQVLVCPNTCSGTLHNSAGSEVDILFGCDTKPAIVH